MRNRWYITSCYHPEGLESGTIALLQVSLELLAEVAEMVSAVQAAQQVLGPKKNPTLSLIRFPVGLYWLTGPPECTGEWSDEEWWEFGWDCDWVPMPPHFRFFDDDEEEAKRAADSAGKGWHAVVPERMEWVEVSVYLYPNERDHRVWFKGCVKHASLSAETPSLTQEMLGTPLERLAMLGRGEE